MLLWFRTWRRRRAVGAYERQNGSIYDYFGVQVQLPADFSVDLKNALLKNKYETEEREYVERFLPQRCDVIELGASVGVLAAFTRSRMRPDAKQVIVEANPELAQICAQNVARQDVAKKTEVIQAAVSYQDADTVSFGIGANPHVGRVGDTGVGRIDVPVVTLEAIVNSYAISDFVLICDIEGAELELFEKSTVWRKNCRLIILETHPNEYVAGSVAQSQLIASILDSGFKVLAENRGVYALGRELE